jgi:lysyl-tRNA synthetase class 2
VLKGLDLGAAGLSALLLAMLIVVRGRFHALPGPRNRWRAVQAFVGLAGAGFLLGFIEVAIRANRLVGHPGVVHWAQEAALGLIGLDGPVRFQFKLGGDLVSYTTGASGLLAVVVAVVVLLRPGERRPQRTEDDERALRALLERYGSADSLGYFALRTDKSLMWARGQRREPGLGRPDRARVGLARGDRGLARRQLPPQLYAGRARLRGGRRSCVPQGRARCDRAG